MNDDVEMSSNTCNAGSRILWGEGVRSPNGSPPCRCGGVWVGRSCLWTRTARGSVGRAGHPHGGWCCSGEVRLGRRFEGRHSLCAKKRWLLGKRLTIIGGILLLPLQLLQALVHGGF